MYVTSIIAGAAVLLAQATSVLAFGSASVYNDCGVPVYYKVVSTSDPGFATIPAGGVHQTYSEPGVGWSIKLALNNSISAPVSQFEFTLAGASNYIAYDLSNINGYPFAAGGITIEPSVAADNAFPTCVPVSCPAGTEVCTAAYNQPNDVDTLVCAEGTSLTMTLCSGKALARRVLHVHKPRHARHPHARPE